MYFYFIFSTRDFKLSNVLRVSTAKQNLLFVHQFAKDNVVSLEFYPTHFLVKDKVTGMPLARGLCSDGVYHIAHRLL